MNKPATTKIKVGIIDSGINTELADSLATTLIARRDFSDREQHHCPDTLGHGSAVASIIIATTTDIEIVIARVFADKLVCTANQVSHAIDWLCSQQVDVINMSFGLRDDRPQLLSACQQAIANNCLLIAAAPASGSPVYPAQYQGVIRATGDARCRPLQLSHLNSQQADYGACPRYEGIAAAGASIGCAGVSGMIAKLLSAAAKTTSRNVHLQLQRQANYHGIEQRRQPAQEHPQHAR
jgi:hypothetical protein